jgi:hypothetical protein
MKLSPYHAKYFAYDLTRRAADGIDRLSMSLFDAAVDLNPHQIEAALFALESPLSKGVILADEVGLGKTIEAGIVLCQFWAERKRCLLVICPSVPAPTVGVGTGREVQPPDPRPPRQDVPRTTARGSAFLQRPHSYALPQRQRHLTALILRKLLASSSLAIAATLDTLSVRLEALREDQAQSDPEFTEHLIEEEELEVDLLDEILAEDDLEPSDPAPITIDRQKLGEEPSHPQVALQLGSKHRCRCQDADLAQSSRHWLRTDGDHGRGTEDLDLHGVPHSPFCR